MVICASIIFTSIWNVLAFQPTIAPSATAPLMIESSQKNSSLKQSEKAVNMLDNHLYEKAMEKHAMENSSHSNYGDRLVAEF